MMFAGWGCAGSPEQIRDREATARAESLRQLIIDLAREINDPSSAQAGPYELRLDAEGRPVLIVTSDERRQTYRIDVEDRTLIPTTRSTTGPR
jgi:hypothetical protein